MEGKIRGKRERGEIDQWLVRAKEKRKEPAEEGTGGKERKGLEETIDFIRGKDSPGETVTIPYRRLLF